MQKDLLVELRKKGVDVAKVIPHYLRLGCAFVLLLGAVACASVSLTEPLPTPGIFCPRTHFLAHLACMFEQYVPRIFIVRQDVVYTDGVAVRLCVSCGVAWYLTRCLCWALFCLSSESVCCHCEGHSYFKHAQRQLCSPLNNFRKGPVCNLAALEWEWFPLVVAYPQIGCFNRHLSCQVLVQGPHKWEMAEAWANWLFIMVIGYWLWHGKVQCWRSTGTEF